MGLVEDQVMTVGRNENDEVGTEAAVANFANDRESNPILSNPNLIMNCCSSSFGHRS